MKLLILGLGNDLYGDDGIGIHIIERLTENTDDRQNFGALLDDVDLQACGLTGLAILDEIIGYDRLIIIDTIKRCDPQAGRIHILAAEELRHIPGPSPHYVSIPQTIAIGRQLGLRVPSHIKIIAIEAKDLFHLGEGLSPEIENKIPEILEELKNLIEEIKQ